ncbi:MAG: glycoside hydrolase family 3 C-terminal domain-containing protein [Clostridia bacterium]|nr:glycoside hydrolase family 3 C-terminal domain-containing protein [Clostridia bacterium]
MRNFFYKWTGLWRTLAVVFALIMAFGFTVGALLEANSSQVNRVLHTTTTTVSGGDYSAYEPDDAYVTRDEDGSITSGDSQALVDAHIDLGTQVGAEGSVLLQNENDALPFSASTAKVTLFGYASAGINYDLKTPTSGMYFGMAMGGDVETTQSISLYDALKSRDVDVNSAMNTYYINSVVTNKNLLVGGTTIKKASAFTPYEVQPDTTNCMTGYSTSDKGSGNTSIGIVVVGRPSTESADYYPGSLGVSSSTGRSVLALTTDELSVISAAKSVCDKVIVLVNACNPMELGPIMTGGAYAVDAIMWIGYPGNYGTYGIADVLVGNTSPSGHLSDTYAYNSTSSPAMQNYGIYKYTNGDDVNVESSDDFRGSYYVVEAEGIYTGYKYYETRYEDAVLGDTAASGSAGAFDSADSTVAWNTDGKSTWNYDEEVAYSFGYGKSYTTFEQTIKDVTFSDDYKTAYVTVDVENTGDTYAGRSVVQVYGQSPYYFSDGTTSNIEKASVQLLNYAKTPEIPAETKLSDLEGYEDGLTIEINMELLASYDETINNGDGTYGNYVLEAADNYYFALGCNDTEEGAHAAVNNILESKATTTQKANMDETGNASAAWKFSWDSSNSGIFATDEVSNKLSDANLNNLGTTTTVGYLSRSDWAWTNGSGWNTSLWSSSNTKGYSSVTATDDMLTQLRNKTYTAKTDDNVDDIKFDQENNLTFADMIGLEYDDPLWDDLLDELNLEEAIKFVINGNSSYLDLTTINYVGVYMAENGPTGLQAAMPSTYDAPWYDENDPNMNYCWNDMGSASLQASTFDQELLEEIGVLWGNDSLFVNCPMLWAPALNLHRTPYNGRTGEYYSEDSCLTGYSASSVAQGAESKGFIVTIKHFAFNDQESNRCGVAAYFSEQQARENELRGFQIAIEGGVKAVMTSYNRIGATFSSASGLMDILRDEWDFKGYVVTDLVQSKQYVTFAEAVVKGTSTFDVNYADVVDYWGDAASIANTYKNDATVLQAIKDAVHSTLWTFAHTNIANYMTSDASSVWVMNWWRATYISLEVVGGVVAAASVVLYILSLVLGKKKEDPDGPASENGEEVQS